MRKLVVSVVAALALASACQTTAAPAALVDPPRDAAHPARMEVLHIPSGGVEINGVAYLASGAGTHPTLVIAHGWPGNEKNLDLAQAVRRAGWNAVTFNYRGSWGSPGEFHFTQVPEDATAVISYLHQPAVAAKYGIDPKRIEGLNLRVTIPIESTDGEVLAVPVAALVTDAGGTTEVRVHRDDGYVDVPVTPGLSAEGFAEVTPTASGLAEGDLVVVGQQW